VPGFPALLGTDFSQMSRADKVELLQTILRHKIHGISFSPYVDGQSPGAEISEHQIRERLSIIQPYTHWIRSFSCKEGNQKTPRIAHDNGLKTMVGVVLSEDLDANEIELRNGIEVARAGHADILAVGNEVMLREDLTEDQLIAYIERARAAVPGVPVGIREPSPRGRGLRYAAGQLLSLLGELPRRVCPVVHERNVSTGAERSRWQESHHQRDRLADRRVCFRFEIFYFSSFDESWKIGDEGDVGAYWGLWDKDGNLKYA
jgi:exo-beta-1,3-glucanase (GH17 family)